ncbi:hypothetical protein NEOKW01_1105 [Nematocida sp. AWRm80]|nr:hypothetical protein NEOKW01_1105 [Nematocida sp. AWRm80]
MIEGHYLIDKIDTILNIIAERNPEASTLDNYTEYFQIQKVPEFVYLEELIDYNFPHNIGIYIPDILVPVNLKYTQEKTETLAMHILNDNLSDSC